MASIQKLREQRNSLANTLRNLVDEQQTPEWSGDQQAQYDAAMADLDKVDSQIKRHNDAMSAIAANASAGVVTDDEREAFTKLPGKHEGADEGLRNYLKGGMNALTQEQYAAMNARPGVDIRNTMSTGTDAQGGYTVAEEFADQLTEAMKAYGGVRSVATVIRSATGANMNFPTANETAEEGEIVGENVLVDDKDPAFGNIPIGVYKYSSKAVAIPFELIQDSMFDLESWIQAILGRRIGRITSKHFAVGSGTGQPHGLVPHSGVGVTLNGNTAVAYDDLVDLWHSVDPVYRANAKWMMHDDTVGEIRKLVDGVTGRPLFVPGYSTEIPGASGSQPDTLMGREIVVDQAMDVLGTIKKNVIAWGDFSKYVIRDVMDLTVFRMTDSAFTLKGQVGFVAFQRQGGRLVDVGGAVKHLRTKQS